MPVIRYTPSRPADMDQLVDQLAAEWKCPGSSSSAPVILEEPNSRGEIIHLYVVWDAWAHLDREKRGEVIMDAAERVKTPADVLKITIAMGLTAEEADRFRLKWR